MKVPTKLKIVPILEAIFEIRFDTMRPEDTNVGVIYNEFQDDFHNVESLPILSIPQEIRAKDEAIKYQPHQKMVSKDGNYLLQYGQRQISLHRINYSYDVFDNFSGKIVDLVKRVQKLNIINTVNRIGLRYTDFLDDSIDGYHFDDLNINVDIAGMGRGKELICSTVFEGKRSTHKTKIYNNVKINHNEKEKFGDLIDIDSFLGSSITLDKVRGELGEIHNEQKEIFFGLLGDKVTNLLGPDYEN